MNIIILIVPRQCTCFIYSTALIPSKMHALLSTYKLANKVHEYLKMACSWVTDPKSDYMLQLLTVRFVTNFWDNPVKLYWIKVFVQHVAKFLEYMAEIDCAHIVMIYIILIGKGHTSLKKMINAERALAITRHWWY